MAEPKNKKLYSRVKRLSKKKFKVYPSAYANYWLSREYKKEEENIKVKNLNQSVQV